MTGSRTFVLPCPRCSRELPEQVFEREGAVCAGCEAYVEAAVFPALLRGAEPAIWEPVVAGEAACFFHSDRVAAFTCSRCGRFLCPLCRIPWPDGDVCTACLEVERKEQRARTFASVRIHFDSLALAFSTLPILTWIFSLLSAPIALGFAVFTFRRECSIAPRSKIRFVLAILFSTLTIAGWVVLFVYLGLRNSRSPTPANVNIGIVP
jgi:hypothetical protein